MTLRLAPRQLAAIRRHARRCYPEECCGLLLGRAEGDGRRVVDVVAARNCDPAPRRGYAIDPLALLRAHRAAREGQPAVVGYYHSHPDCAAEPSRRDRCEALPAVSYLILPVLQGRPGAARSFRVDGDAGAMVEEAMEVTAT